MSCVKFGIKLLAPVAVRGNIEKLPTTIATTSLRRITTAWLIYAKIGRFNKPGGCGNLVHVKLERKGEKFMFHKLVDTANDRTITIIRLILGIVFFAHGAQKALGLF